MFYHGAAPLKHAPGHVDNCVVEADMRVEGDTRLYVVFRINEYTRPKTLRVDGCAVVGRIALLAAIAISPEIANGEQFL